MRGLFTRMAASKSTITMCIGIPAGRICSLSTVYDINGACYIISTGSPTDVGYSISKFLRTNSPNLGYDHGMWTVNAGGNTDHYYGAGWSSGGALRINIMVMNMLDTC